MLSPLSFYGGPVLTLDQKGRVPIPARYRDALRASTNGRLWVIKNKDRCLMLLPEPVYERLHAQVVELPAEHEGYKRMFIGDAMPVEMDAASRVLIPPELRKWAGLEREVKFMGMGAYFELWDVARYEASEEKLLAAPQPEALRRIVIK
jgi:MraZ protein